MRFLTNEKLSDHRYKTKEGYLVCVDAIIARTGKQQYNKNELFSDSDDATEIDVDRPYEEVFSPETIASFENKPFVNEHPDEDVNIDNFRNYSIGWIRDVHEGTDEGKPVLLANIIVTDPEAIKQIENNEKVQLSCGYDCEIMQDDKENYYQHKIRGNHLALCETGRAGNARIQDSVNDNKIIKYKGFTIEFLEGYQSPQFSVYNKNGFNMNSHLSTTSDLKQIKKEIDLGYLDDYIQDSIDNDKDIEIETRIELDYRNGKLTSKKDILNEVKRLEERYKTTYSKDIINYLERNGYFVDSVDDSIKDGSGILSSGQSYRLKKYCDKYEFDFNKALKKIENKFYEYQDKGYHRTTDDVLEEILEDMVSGSYKDSIKDVDIKGNFEKIQGRHFPVRLNPRSTISRIKGNLDIYSWINKEGIEEVLYYFDNNTQETFINKKYFIPRDFEDSIKDVNPKEGESKEDFISRFMSETKSEYPDEKQRFAVANSYWERKDSISDSNLNSYEEEKVEHLVEQYEGIWNHNKSPEQVYKEIERKYGKKIATEVNNELERRYFKDSIKDYNYEEDETDYFGKDQYEKYGKLVYNKLRGRTISKRLDDFDEPGGLGYESKKLGISHNDLLRCLEGMCFNGLAKELYPGNSYKIKDSINDEVKTEIKVKVKNNEPHYEGYVNGKFISSGDTKSEVEKDIKEYLKGHKYYVYYRSNDNQNNDKVNIVQAIDENDAIEKTKKQLGKNLLEIQSVVCKDSVFDENKAIKLVKNIKKIKDDYSGFLGNYGFDYLKGNGDYEYWYLKYNDEDFNKLVNRIRKEYPMLIISSSPERKTIYIQKSMYKK